ncbi:MAG: hypothetical protein AABW79_02045 [Nanoarchaeota archaeon]
MLSLIMLQIQEYSEDLADGEVASFRGVVESQRTSNGVLYLHLEDLTVSCKCQFRDYVGAKIEVIGLLDSFEGRRYLRAFKIIYDK